VSTFFEGGKSLSLGQGGGFLYWAADSELYRSSSGGGAKQDVGPLPAGRAEVSADDAHVYWGDPLEETLHRRGHGSSVDELVASNIKFAYVSWATNHFVHRFPIEP
jgi:hypothetical protein